MNEKARKSAIDRLEKIMAEEGDDIEVAHAEGDDRVD